MSVPRGTRSRSNSASQAVSVVSGIAAASAKERELAMRPTIRSSTSWSSALLPGRFTTPAHATRSPGRNSVQSGPVASTTPAPSKPSTRGSPAGSDLARSFASTGFTETAFTTRRSSRPLGAGGAGRIMSSSASGSVTGRQWR